MKNCRDFSCPGEQNEQTLRASVDFATGMELISMVGPVGPHPGPGPEPRAPGPGPRTPAGPRAPGPRPGPRPLHVTVGFFGAFCPDHLGQMFSSLLRPPAREDDDDARRTPLLSALLAPEAAAAPPPPEQPFSGPGSRGGRGRSSRTRTASGDAAEGARSRLRGRSRGSLCHVASRPD